MIGSKRKTKDKGSSRKRRTKKRKRKSRKIHEMREGSSGSSSESDKSTSTSGSTSSDESDTDESPQIDYFDNFILALEMDSQGSNSPDIDKEIEEFLSNLPCHDKEDEQATSSSLSVLGAALAEAMDTDVTETVTPSSSCPAAVEVIELPESSTQINAETSSSKDFTKVPVKPNTEVTITTGDTITFMPAFVFGKPHSIAEVI